MTSSWFFLSTLNYDARSTTHLIKKHLVGFIIRTAGKISKSSGINLLQFHFIPHKSHKEWVDMHGKNQHNYRLSYMLQPAVKTVNQYITTFLFKNTFVQTVRFLRHFCAGRNCQLSEVRYTRLFGILP